MNFSASGEMPAALLGRLFGRPSREWRAVLERERPWEREGLLLLLGGRLAPPAGERVGAIEARRVWLGSVEYCCCVAGLPV